MKTTALFLSGLIAAAVSGPAMRRPAVPGPAAPSAKSAEGSLEAAVPDFVASRLDLEDGTYHQWDEEEDGTWELSFQRVLPKTLRNLGGGRWSVCAEFLQAAAEEGEGDVPLDLDFIAKKGPKGWSFEEVLIHRVDGRARFTYDEQSRRLPVRHAEEEAEAKDINL